MNTIPQNQVYFGASLHSGIKTKDARRILQAAAEFQQKTAKKYPSDSLHIKSGAPIFDCPVLALDPKADLMHCIPAEFLGINDSLTKNQIAQKLVKAFKILLEDKKLWLADWRKNENIAEQGVKRMEKIAGKDGGLQEYINAVKTGLGIDL